MSTRREFLSASIGAGLMGITTPASVLAQAASMGDGLKILILGGTGFIGPHLVTHAMQRGHKITLFNRGRTNTHLFPDAEKLVGDRNNDISALEGRRWDAVIDNSGYTPQQLTMTVDLLEDNVDQYLFTSTRSVYTDFTQDVMDEDAPVGPKDIPESEWEGYGPNKVLAERVVQKGFGARTLITRTAPIALPTGSIASMTAATYWCRGIRQIRCSLLMFVIYRSSTYIFSSIRSPASTTPKGRDRRLTLRDWCTASRRSHPHHLFSTGSPGIS
jgi:hypothetical protein